MLLQHGADPKLRNTEGKTALDVADPVTRPVLSGNDYRKEELLEAARSGKMQIFIECFGIGIVLSVRYTSIPVVLCTFLCRSPKVLEIELPVPYFTAHVREFYNKI
jgi:hypothetical protein